MLSMMSTSIVILFLFSAVSIAVTVPVMLMQPCVRPIRFRCVCFFTIIMCTSPCELWPENSQSRSLVGPTHSGCSCSCPRFGMYDQRTRLRHGCPRHNVKVATVYFQQGFWTVCRGVELKLLIIYTTNNVRSNRTRCQCKFTLSSLVLLFTF